MSRTVSLELPEPDWVRRSPLRFGYEVLRGVAQVDFMPSAVCGVFFVAALFASGWQYGVLGVLGTVVSTGVAYGLGVDRERIRVGFEGFNGCLVAVSFGVFLGPGYFSTWVMAGLGAVFAAVVTGALVNLLRPWGMPTFTLPFCLIASVVTIAAPGFQRVWHEGGALSELPSTASGSSALGWGDLGSAFLSNVGQIFLMPQWYVGLLFLVGIFVADLHAGVLACVGSVVGILTAWGLGAPAGGVTEGLLGYNAVLVAMALGSVFVERGWFAFGYAVAGAVASTVLTVAVTSFFAPFGGHTLTWPYILTTLFFLAAVPAFPRLRRR